MSVHYDLLEKPDVRKTGEQQPLYARFVPKGTLRQKEFIDRVHCFTGISHSVLEGAMAAFTDELRDCLAQGFVVELGELGYFSPSLSCRNVMEKKELRAASVSLRGLNFRLSKSFADKLRAKVRFERSSQSSLPSEVTLSEDQCRQQLEKFLQKFPCISRTQYSSLTGRSYKQAVNDLNRFIENGVLQRMGMGRNVVYVRGELLC